MNANDSRENACNLEEQAKNMSVTCNVRGESTFNDEYDNKYACGILNCWVLDVNDSSDMGILFCSNWLDSENEEKEESEPAKQVSFRIKFPKCLGVTRFYRNKYRLNKFKFQFNLCVKRNENRN